MIAPLRISPATPAALLFFCASVLGGCVYFNTYYNAQRYFRQAEKARKAIEQQQPERTDREDRRARPYRSQQRSRGGKAPNDLYEQAARKASKVLEKHRDSDLVDDAMFLLGRAFYWQGDYRDAARSFRDLETNFPESEYFTRARYWRGLCFEGQGDFAEARSLYRALFSAATDAEISALAGYRLGEMAFEQEEYASAIQEYRSTLESFPKAENRAELWLRLGEAAVALEDSSLFATAAEAFAEVLRESPTKRTEYRARLEQGRLLYQMGEVEKARDTYWQLLKDGSFRPFEGRTRLLIGQYYEDQGLPEKALEEFTRIRDDFPQTDASAMAIYRTSLIYLSRNADRVLAREYLETVSAEKRNSEAAQLAKETLSDLKEAEKLLRKIHVADSLDAAEAAAADSATLALALAAESDSAAVAGDAPGQAETAIFDKEVNQILPGIEMTAVPPADSAELADVATAPADTAISGRKVDQAFPSIEMPGVIPADSAAVAADATASTDTAHSGREVDEAFPGIEMPGVIPADSAAVAADATASTDTTHSGNEVDEALAGIGMTEVPAASGVRNGEDGEAGSRTSSAGRRKKWEDPRKKLDETILAVAEIYRDRLAMPDSAIHFYLEFKRRFPESHQVPRALYSIAWIHTEMKGDEESAASWLQRLVQDFPLTEHANAARELLGHVRDVTAEQRALEEYERIEKIRLEDIDSLDRYMPEFDRLIAEYPATESGARALWLTAWTYENVAGDTTAAEDRYARIAEEFPGTLLATHALERGEARAEGLLDKLEREFITLRGGEKPGEKVTTIAVEPDTADSVLLARKYLGFALRAHRRGVLETAREYYELCLQEKQRSPEALFGLGEIAWEGAYFDDALDYFHDSLRMRGNLVGVYYRLFAVHTREGRADSSNHYLREILRKDRDNPAVISLRDEFPTLESEDLDMSTLEEIDLPLPPPEDLYAPPRSLLPLREEAVVRKSSLPVLPAGAEVDSAEVIVDILVTVEGKPAVVEAFVGDESLVPEALETARQYVFFPAIDLDGEKAEVWVEIAIPFYPSRGTDPRPTSESVAGGADSILPETVAANDGVPVATVPPPVQRQATDSGSGQQETE